MLECISEINLIIKGVIDVEHLAGSQILKYLHQELFRGGSYPGNSINAHHRPTAKKADKYLS